MTVRRSSSAGRVHNAGPDQEVHLQAVSHTFCLTLLAVMDALNTEKDIELELDRYCGGLIASGPLPAAPSDDCTGSLDPKIDRRGRKISCDEIAEGYRSVPGNGGRWGEEGPRKDAAAHAALIAATNGAFAKASLSRAVQALREKCFVGGLDQ